MHSKRIFIPRTYWITHARNPCRTILGEAPKIDFEPVVRIQSKLNAKSHLSGGFWKVGHTGFEPVTSALSRQRSKPTELIPQKIGRPKSADTII